MVELHEVEWTSLGHHLGVPEVTIRTIQRQYIGSSPRHCLMQVLGWWMDSKDESEITWVRIAVALREMHQYNLSDKIICRYCRSGTMETDGPGDPTG